MASRGLVGRDLQEHNPIQAVQTGGQLMESSVEATTARELLSSPVPQGMFNGHVLPTLKNHSIISLGKICDTGCEVLLAKKRALILHNDMAILGGIRKHIGLWYLHKEKLSYTTRHTELCHQ